VALHSPARVGLLPALLRYLHLVAALSAVVVIATATILSTNWFTPSNHVLGQNLAQQLQGRAVLPTSAESQPGPPGGVRLWAQSLPYSADRIDLISYWRIPVQVGRVTIYLEAHPPAGLVSDLSSWSEPGGSLMVAFQEAHVPPFASLALLEYSYRPDGGDTLLRLDSLVIWLPPRLPVSLVPSQDRYVGLTVAWMGRTWTGDLHASAKLRVLIAVVDGLPTKAPAGSVSCGIGATITFRFGVSSAAAPNFTLFDDTGCDQIVVTSIGSRPLLQEGGLPNDVLHLLGLTSAELYSRSS
jgi:hypothetical protein